MTREDCPCKKAKCSRHGKCDECKEHHMNKKLPPYCERSVDSKRPRRERKH